MKAPRGAVVIACCICDKTVGWIEDIEGYRQLTYQSPDATSPWPYLERPLEVTEKLLERLPDTSDENMENPGLITRCKNDHITRMVASTLRGPGRRRRLTLPAPPERFSKFGVGIQREVRDEDR